MPFEVFRKSLSEHRKYLADECVWDKLVKGEVADYSHAFRVMKKGNLQVLIEGTHVMNAGCDNGLANLEQRLAAPLPKDFVSFYGKWNGGLLFLGLCFELLDEIRMIEITERILNARKMAPTTPWRIFR